MSYFPNLKRRPRARSGARFQTRSGARLQPDAEARPSHAVKQQVDAEQDAEDINAVERPMAHNDQTEHDRYGGGEKDEGARMVGWKLCREIGAHNTGRDEAGAEEKRQ